MLHASRPALSPRRLRHCDVIAEPGLDHGLHLRRMGVQLPTRGCSPTRRGPRRLVIGLVLSSAWLPDLALNPALTSERLEFHLLRVGAAPVSRSTLLAQGPAIAADVFTKLRLERGLDLKGICPQLFPCGCTPRITVHTSASMSSPMLALSLVVPSEWAVSGFSCEGAACPVMVRTSSPSASSLAILRRPRP